MSRRFMAFAVMALLSSGQTFAQQKQEVDTENPPDMVVPQPHPEAAEDERSANKYIEVIKGVPHYRLGPLKIKVPGGQFNFDIYQLKAALVGVGPSTYPAFYPKYSELIEQLQKQVQDPHFNRRVRRETTDQGAMAEQAEAYRKERFHYVFKGFERQAGLFGKTPQSHGMPPRVVGQCPSKHSAYSFSLIPFKTGDLDDKCKETVDRGVAAGHDKITLHFPIHYSSAHSGGAPKSKGSMMYGWDYQYEDAFGIGAPELNRCMDYIMASGLKLNYVPHLESIVTMNATSEAEWRIASDIPLDKQYYDRAFGPLQKYLAQNKSKVSGKTINVSVAAELDPTFLGNTENSLQTIKRLKSDLKSAGTKSEVIWSPNGDFYNGFSDFTKQNLKCDKMVELMENVDRIAPSLYEGYGHVIGSSYRKTKEHFFEGMNKKMKDLCPNEYKGLKKTLEGRKFSITEFSLDNSGDYQKFHQEMQEEAAKTGDDGVFAAFWNNGKWDHSGIGNPKNINGKYKSNIDSVVGRCPAQEAKDCPPATAPTPAINEHLKTGEEIIDQLK